ncbi:MAG: TolC family protein [Bacteroidaceae bacterium]|nr:TolC family protein [Bacteroidaceae bacterium]
MNAKLYTSLICVVATVPLCAQPSAYSYAEAEALMLQASDALKVTDAQLQIARHERGKAKSWWWPHLQADGAYAHLSEPIEVRQPLSQYTDPIKAHVLQLDPTEELITGLLDKVGSYTFTLPLIPQDVASVGLTAEWVAFSGGKRLYADKLAQQMVDMAETNVAQTKSLKQVELVERYYGLALAQQTTEVCRERYESLRRHYEQALRMEQVGIIDRAARLLAQVGMEEALSEWQQAQSRERNAALALSQLLGISSDAPAPLLTSALFIVSSLPPESVFAEHSTVANHALILLGVEERMAHNELRMAQSGYLPEIALFGKQTLYAHGLPSNLLPRTLVGVGFTWNLFDGLSRERQISQARLAQQSLVWSRAQAEQDVALTVSRLYATLRQMAAEAHVLDTTIALHAEVLRVRQSAFAEGMATSTEVLDATHALATAKLARLAAYYAYDVALAGMLAACGMMDDFHNYASNRF